MRDVTTTAQRRRVSLARVELLAIGAFSRRSRLSPKALRLYDRLGLLTPASVDESNGYRRYREDQVETARLIALLRRLDMPLATVAEVLTAPEPRRAELVSEYWATVEHRVASQRELAAHLRLQLSGDERSFDMCEIHVRDVPDQVVLTEQRHVRVPELQTWLPAAMDRLVASAADRGGASGPAFVVYHGEVSEDSDGPVEVCVPVATSEGAADAPVRTEPAHREAYTTITKAQVAYPQILSAYDAVAAWVQAEMRTITGSPREVYFADFDAAAPTDEVCDIAFPVAAEG